MTLVASRNLVAFWRTARFVQGPRSQNAAASCHRRVQNLAALSEPEEDEASRPSLGRMLSRIQSAGGHRCVQQGDYLSESYEAAATGT